MSVKKPTVKEFDEEELNIAIQQAPKILQFYIEALKNNIALLRNSRYPSHHKNLLSYPKVTE